MIVDEPEVHLHPSAVSSFIESLRNVVGSTGQIWIASHAVSLLPMLDHDQIWMVHDGQVCPPSIERAHEALERLVGSQASVQRLTAFLQEPARWAAEKFAAECLSNATVVGYKAADPQLELLTKALSDSEASEQKIRIIDFGAGRGRFITALRETYPDAAARFEYLPVEPTVELHASIANAAGPLLAQCGVKTEVSAIPTEYDRKCSFAVLCNVLHEVRPNQWAQILNEILDRLHEDGIILICEDQKLPIGELPHDLGFVVLNAAEVKHLFSLSAPPAEVSHPSQRYRERIACISVPCRSAKVDHHSVIDAIKNAHRRLENEIKTLRTSTSGKAQASHGRDYALKSQQYVNATLALKELDSRR